MNISDIIAEGMLNLRICKLFVSLLNILSSYVKRTLVKALLLVIIPKLLGIQRPNRHGDLPGNLMVITKFWWGNFTVRQCSTIDQQYECTEGTS